MPGEFKINVKNSFDFKKEKRNVIINKEPDDDVCVLYPNGSGKEDSKEFTLVGGDSLTIYIDDALGNFGSCTIWLPERANVRFISSGKVDFTQVHEGSRQKIVFPPDQPSWRLVIISPTSVISTTSAIAPGEPPPDNVTIGDEGPG